MHPPRLNRPTALLVSLALGLLGWFWWRSESTAPVSPGAKTAQAVREPLSAAAAVAESARVNEFPATLPSALRALRDDPQSSHPVEQAIARGQVLATRWRESVRSGEWQRERLILSDVQPGRVLRAVERWQKRDGAEPQNLVRDLYLADQLIVNLTPSSRDADAAELLGSLGAQLVGRIGPGSLVVRLPAATLDATNDGLAALARRTDLVRSAEADGVGFGGGVPNDPLFSSQWGWHNTGQTSGTVTGTVDADVDAPEFWDLAGDATGVVIAVLDSGLNFTHADLNGVAWSNPGEIAGDGVDNDGSGKVDDVLGWDFVNNDNNPADDHGHGTNVTGIMVALRNNGVGTAGLISGAKILTCKILNASNSGLTSNLIAATTYARLRGARIMNLSLQNYPLSTTLDTEFTACQNAGILLSICAGNQGVNNDTTPNYPSSYPHACIIAVGNHDRTDQRWSGTSGPSNYGATSVDLFAPGREIVSTGLGTGYSTFTGTSQATPAVTAVCAALLALNPQWSAPDLKSAIFGSIYARPAYSGLCVTGGRLNAVSAFGYILRQRGTRDSDGDGYADLFEYLAGTQISSASSKPTLTTELVGNSLRLRGPRIPRKDAHFEVEASMDLVSWSTTGVVDESSPLEIIGRMQIPTDPPTIFLRLKAVDSP